MASEGLYFLQIQAMHVCGKQFLSR